jgi:hypothetical protein
MIAKLIRWSIKSVLVLLATLMVGGWERVLGV